MNDKNQTTPAADQFVDEIIEVAGTWLQTGLSIGKAAVAATADGMRATSESLARLADDVDDVDEG
ncbi:MAG: hypothetical protein CL910_12635 [Deltaproteobacteria bacterium]|jgi:hypothetical protein|nr:hypothetical protein [Deltaproteobacteria bacterium]